jgi:hypothetical protein
VSATGGTVTDNGGYRIHTFTGSGTLTVTTGGSVEVLVVGGGGGGGAGYSSGAGGGGGGVLHKTAHAVSAASYSIVVGAGGAGAASQKGANGGNSSAFDLTAFGGGGGGLKSDGLDGGSGGGANADSTTTRLGGSATQTSQDGATGYGSAGASATGNYKGGGGGGAGAAGSGNNGGVGQQSSITGTATYYAGGGGTGWGGTGGLGGGGTTTAGGAGDPGDPNTGGGGAGGRDNNAAGGQGGSGIVIVRYAIALTEEGFPDANGNGVDDRWEQEHWPDGPPPATVMKRGREMPLRDVFVADLDPHNEDIVLEITRFGLLWKDAAWHTELDFGPASTRRLYDLESSPHLTGGWQRVRGDIVPGEPSFRLETPVAEEPQQFYRIQVRLPPPEELE